MLYAVEGGEERAGPALNPLKGSIGSSSPCVFDSLHAARQS